MTRQENGLIKIYLEKEVLQDKVATIDLKRESRF